MKRMLNLWAAVIFLLLVTTNSHSQNVPADANVNVVPIAEKNSEYKLALEAIFGMGIRLQVLLGTQDPQNAKNFVVSPLSATTVIGQLLLGAEGQFRDQLYDLLSLPKATGQQFTIHHYNKNENKTYGKLPYGDFHLQLSSLLKVLENQKTGELFTLKQKNALFYDKKITLKHPFEKYLNKFYDTELYPVESFGGSDGIINEWASNNTNGLIKNVLSGPPDPGTASIFMNAIYFLAEWETPFSDLLNREGSFSVTATKKVETTYMLGFLDRIQYVQTSEYRLIFLPYKNKELDMIILLPNGNNTYKYDIQRFAESLNPKEVLEQMSKTRANEIVLMIPKLSLSNSVSFLEPLKKFAEYKKQVTNSNDSKGNDEIGNLLDKIETYKNFSSPIYEDIYLTGAAENRSLRLSDIVQQLVFSINEKGTEAAAVSLSVIDYIGGSKNFILNRPFMFFITHKSTSATLFWGTISDPTQS